MQKGLDKIGLGKVGWKLFSSWIWDWGAPLVMAIVCIVAVRRAPIIDRIWFTIGCLGILNGLLSARAFLNPWIHKPKDLTLAEAEYLLGIEKTSEDSQEEPSF